MTVLELMAPLRRSASNTLQLLQGAYRQAVPCSPQQTGPKADALQLSGEIPQSNDTSDHPDLAQPPFFNWEEFAANMGPGLDDLGFLTRLDFLDTLASGGTCFGFD